MNLVDSLIQGGWLKTKTIIEAFKKIKREDFLPDDIKNLAEVNEALPIGFGQTISQPLVVVFMLEQLQPQKEDKVLDVGAGSGWTTALLSELVGETGKVTALEVVPELKEFGENNVSKYSFIKKVIAQFICKDGTNGFEENAPYDKILVSASGDKVPEELKKQLKVGGRMVIPVGQSILTIIKKSDTEFEEIEHSGFVFVPLIQKTR